MSSSSVNTVPPVKDGQIPKDQFAVVAEPGGVPTQLVEDASGQCLAVHVLRDYDQQPPRLGSGLERR
jgi:hypothetical protein